jgi:hypothetical protein
VAEPYIFQTKDRGARSFGGGFEMERNMVRGKASRGGEKINIK